MMTAIRQASRQIHSHIHLSPPLLPITWRSLSSRWTVHATDQVQVKRKRRKRERRVQTGLTNLGAKTLFSLHLAQRRADLPLTLTFSRLSFPHSTCVAFSSIAVSLHFFPSSADIFFPLFCPFFLSLNAFSPSRRLAVLARCVCQHGSCSLSGPRARGFCCSTQSPPAKTSFCKSRSLAKRWPRITSGAPGDSGTNMCNASACTIEKIAG